MDKESAIPLNVLKNLMKGFMIMSKRKTELELKGIMI